MQSPCRIPEKCAVPTPTPTPPPTPPPYQGPSISAAVEACHKDDFFEARGYADGQGVSYTILGHITSFDGEEVVYNFATMERAKFRFEAEPLLDPDYPPKGYNPSYFEVAQITYAVGLNHFDSYKNLKYEYSGRFVGYTLGVATPIIEAGYGDMWVNSPEVSGYGRYGVLGIGYSPFPLSASVGATNYEMINGTEETYATASDGNVTERDMLRMKNHILTGANGGRNYRMLAGPQYEHKINAARYLEQTWKDHENYFRFQYALYKKMQASYALE